MENAETNDEAGEASDNRRTVDSNAIGSAPEAPTEVIMSTVENTHSRSDIGSSNNPMSQSNESELSAKKIACSCGSSFTTAIYIIER